VSAQDKKGNGFKADVYVDGEKVGRSPGTFKISVCAKEVEVKHKKHGVWKRTLSIQEHKVTKLDAVLVSMGVAGKWEGRACQSSGSCWTITVEARANSSDAIEGVIAYPSLGCAARLEFVRWDGQSAVFRERFTQNPGKRCVENGWLWLTSKGEGNLEFKWAYPNGRVDSLTTLSKAR